MPRVLLCKIKFRLTIKNKKIIYDDNEFKISSNKFDFGEKKLDEKIKDEIEKMKRPNQNQVFTILRNLNKSGTIINR